MIRDNEGGEYLWDSKLDKKIKVEAELVEMRHKLDEINSALKRVTKEQNDKAVLNEHEQLIRCRTKPNSDICDLNAKFVERSAQTDVTKAINDDLSIKTDDLARKIDVICKLLEQLSDRVVALSENYKD